MLAHLADNTEGEESPSSFFVLNNYFDSQFFSLYCNLVLI